KSLDEVKSEIEPVLKHQKGQQIAQKQAEALLKQAREPGVGLDAAAAEQKIPVIRYTTGSCAVRPWLVYCSRFPRAWKECIWNGLVDIVSVVASNDVHLIVDSSVSTPAHSSAVPAIPRPL